MTVDTGPLKSPRDGVESAHHVISIRDKNADYFVCLEPYFGPYNSPYQYSLYILYIRSSAGYTTWGVCLFGSVRISNQLAYCGLFKLFFIVIAPCFWLNLTLCLSMFSWVLRFLFAFKLFLLFLYIYMAPRTARRHGTHISNSKAPNFRVEKTNVWIV